MVNKSMNHLEHAFRFIENPQIVESQATLRLRHGNPRFTYRSNVDGKPELLEGRREISAPKIPLSPPLKKGEVPR